MPHTSLNLEYIYYQVYQFLINLNLADSLYDLWLWLRAFSFLLTIPLLAIVIILARKIVILRRAEGREMREILENIRQEQPQVNPAWERVMEHMASANPNEWRLAIIEADKILDDLVKTMGYIGESLGERLKQVERSDFATLDQAWEAHRVRNRIAHESDYVLPEHEARKTIANYRAVFEEFHII